MKKNILLASLFWLLMAWVKPVTAQKLSSGIITYEVMRKLDPSQIKIVRDGDVLQAGSPDAPDVPDVVTMSQKLLFAGNYAKEERETPSAVIRRLDDNGSGPVGETKRITPPFTEKTYLDVQAKKYIQVLEITKDGETKRYQAEEPFQKSTGWQDTDKTKKIAGYNCRKATCPWKGETYTIWYTTDLDFTYSPINGLMPEKGVVLLLEGSKESFRATRIEAKNVQENELKPQAGTEFLSADELKNQREKAMANFRQQMFYDPLPR